MLDREKEEIRKKLVLLRKEKREVKEQLKDATGETDKTMLIKKSLKGKCCKN